MSWLTIVLRLIHIAAGALWAGASVTFAAFVEPTAAALGQDGGRFLQRMAGKSGFPKFMSAVTLLTIASGAWLYWRDSAGLQPAWILSGPGMSFTIGALAGLVAAVIGFTVQSAAAARLSGLGRQVQAAGGPPSPEIQEQMRALQQRLKTGGMISMAMLVLAVIGMGAARYLP
jgi:hypothetical protein